MCVCVDMCLLLLGQAQILDFPCETMDTIPCDAGLEAQLAHSLHTMYFHKFTPRCLPSLIFEPESLLQVCIITYQTQLASYGSVTRVDNK